MDKVAVLTYLNDELTRLNDLSNSANPDVAIIARREAQLYGILAYIVGADAGGAGVTSDAVASAIAAAILPITDELAAIKQTIAPAPASTASTASKS